MRRASVRSAAQVAAHETLDVPAKLAVVLPAGERGERVADELQHGRLARAPAADQAVQGIRELEAGPVEEPADERLFLAAVNTENIHGEAQMRLDAKFRFDKATRTVEIDRGSEVGRCLAKLFVNYIAKEFGDGAYSVERVDDPFMPEPLCAARDGGLKVVVSEETGQRALNKDGSPRQSAGPGLKLLARTETAEEYGVRLLADIEERPEFYFQRREVPRLEDDLEEFRLECWQQAKLLSDCRRWGRWFRNVGRNTCSFCEYASLCLQSITVEPGAPPAGYQFLANVHPELMEGED